MSANLDLVRSIYADWERGDFSRAEWADTEIDFVIADGPTPGSWAGLAEMAEAHRDFLRAWEDFGVEAEEYRALDDERVLVLLRRSGRGKTSGIELDELHTRGAAIYHVRDSKVTKIVTYYDRDRALADLGLAREGDAADLPGKES
jgi:ketosteroid isomerase-like protein